jgi:hypothetical protein
MSELDSGLGVARLPPEKLALYHAYHRAKQELLRRYMDLWLPKPGFTYDHVALVDGFASAGRHSSCSRIRGPVGCRPFPLQAHAAAGGQEGASRDDAEVDHHRAREGVPWTLRCPRRASASSGTDPSSREGREPPHPQSRKWRPIAPRTYGTA